MLSCLSQSLAIESKNFCFKRKLFNRLSGLPLTAAAFSKARQKIRYTAFKELFQAGARQFYQSKAAVKFRQKYRLLAIDGSTLNLSDSCFDSLLEGKAQERGIPIDQSSPKTFNGERQCHLLALYDPLNQMVVDADVELKDIGERQMAAMLYRHSQRHDIVLADRGFEAKWLSYCLDRRGAFFCTRIKSDQFVQWQHDFLESGKSSVVRELKLSREDRRKIREYSGLKPSKEATVKYRVVRVDLGSEVELLATNLPVKDFPNEDFKELYGMRWGIESFYDTFKNHLAVEGFSSTSYDGILQDIFAKLCYSNIVAELTCGVAARVLKKTKKFVCKLNVRHRLSALKELVADLLFKGYDLVAERLKKELACLGKSLSYTLLERKHQQRKDRRRRRDPVSNVNRKAF